VRVQGFPVLRGEEGYYAWMILFGIDSLQRTGTANVVCTLEGYTGSPEARVIIRGGEFVSEDIPLNEAMSTLNQTEDPERTRQSRVMTQLFYTFNPDNVFLTVPLVLPLTGRRRTSFYGDRRRFLYADGNVSQSVHYGLDFSADPGTPIYSDGPGRVAFSDYRIITGNTVVVEHLPGVYTLYYHMTDRSLEAGARVETGTQIGTVGATGLATGAHLHWEIRVNGVAVSPDFLTQKILVDKEQILGIVRQR
jgi:murein DD-endopeptidase MepM/ murein hydrolase activator NlpD